MPSQQRVRYLGLDLAWGQGPRPNRTGLAVLDAKGALLESTSVRTDDEIAAFAGKHSSDTLVAAIDAPLVVPNAVGRRPCEAAVGALFGRFGAGAYPANRGMASFAPEPRGARLAQRFGWNMDPSVRPGAGRRVCIEVYPHPAMISLFPLDYVIPYKGKSGRELPALQAAYLRLFAGVESTCATPLGLPASARWRELRAIAAGAVRKSELEAIEDEIDAIFCAYLAWLWASAPDQLVVLGDFATGYIVTPTPPTADVVAGKPVRRARPARAVRR